MMLDILQEIDLGAKPAEIGEKMAEIAKKAAISALRPNIVARGVLPVISLFCWGAKLRNHKKPDKRSRPTCSNSHNSGSNWSAMWPFWA
ncbi:MAG: hypothetical protein IT507_03020 [Burkholderiaceae bacterium]|nr:hypothetical protein [Burkholderiaceae bacterium]